MKTLQVLKEAIKQVKLHDKDEFSLLGIVSQLEDEIKLLEANTDNTMLSKL